MQRILQRYSHRLRDAVRHEENALGSIERDVDLAQFTNESEDAIEARPLERKKFQVVLRERLVETDVACRCRRGRDIPLLNIQRGKATCSPQLAL